MKRSTIIILLIAVIAGIAVYYLEYKPGKPRDEEPDQTRAAFSFTREDIAGITLNRGGETIRFEPQKDKWLISQPVRAQADESAINSLLGDLTGTRIERELPATADELKSYGLTSPPVRLEIKLKSGQTHRIDLGSKDVIGSSAYAKIDGSSNVALIGSTLLSSADKSLNEFRDMSLLGVTQPEINGFKVTNESGSYEIAKDNEAWMIKKPVQAPAEDSEVSSLLSDIASAKASEIASETGEEPAQYGLDKPRFDFTAQLATGDSRSISISAKKDDKYYAKVSERPQIYRVESSLIDKLNTKLSALRSRTFVKIDRDALQRIQIKNPDLTLIAENTGDGKWLIREPADKKDKEASAFKLFDSLETKATEVLDRPTAAISGRLAKPPVEVRLIGKDGKTTIVKVSSADGDNAYVRVDAKPEVYKVPKSVLEGLSSKIDEFVSGN